jgi:HEAT repeat protein
MAVRALGEIGVPARPMVPELISLLNDDDYDVAVRAARSLVRITDEIVSNAAEALRASELKYPELGFGIIGAFRERARECVPLLRQFLGDTNAHIRRCAAECLGEIGASADTCVEELINCVSNDSDPAVVAAAAATLGVLGAGEKAVETLVAAVLRPGYESKHQDVNGAVIWALDRNGPKGQRALIHLLNDPDEDVRLTTAMRFTEMGAAGSFAVSALAERLNDRNSWVRRSVSRALAKIGSDGVKSLVGVLAHENARRREEMCKIFVKLGPQIEVAANEVAKLLDDPEIAVRFAASEAIFCLTSMRDWRSANAPGGGWSDDDDDESEIDEDDSPHFADVRVAAAKVMRHVADDRDISIGTRSRALLILKATGTSEQAVGYDGAIEHELRALDLTRDFVLFRKVMRLYGEGARSFRQAAKMMGDELQAGKNEFGTAISAAEITRCIDDLDEFFKGVFGDPDFTSFDRPAGFAASPTKRCDDALRWIDEFLRRRSELLKPRME